MPDRWWRESRKGNSQRERAIRGVWKTINGQGLRGSPEKDRMQPGKQGFENFTASEVLHC
jgi:hypothetical protein